MFESNQLAILTGVFAIFLLAKKFVDYRKAVHSINDWPGFRTILSDRFLFFPFRLRGVSPGPQWSFVTKHKDFADMGWDVLSAVNVLSRAETTFYIADPAIVKDVTGARARYPKATDQYDLLATFGSNILVTEGEEWKRQRKITAPAFSEKNNRLVWDETVGILEDVFQNVWGDNEVVEVDHILDLTVPITLLVIGAAGFGRKISWSEDEITPPGHSMTFKDALQEVSHRLLLKIIFPNWMLRWGTPGMRYFMRASDELDEYLKEMISLRRHEKLKEERNDLFNNLLDANDLETDSQAKLSDDKVIGNVFLFLVAGYETTAHSLAYAFILLALYPDEQELFYQNIKSVLPTGRNPTYDDFASLSYALAVMNEALRLFPPVVTIPKRSAEDTTWTVTNAAGEKATIPVPRDSYVFICTHSLHNNPRYWHEPESFKPARFLGNYTRDAFLPFSGGPRGCIGRGFAETEGVAVLSLIISKYKVEVKEEPQFAGETFEQRKARVLRSQQSLTTYPVRAPLVFRRR